MIKVTGSVVFPENFKGRRRLLWKMSTEIFRIFFCRGYVDIKPIEFTAIKRFS